MELTGYSLGYLIIQAIIAMCAALIPGILSSFHNVTTSLSDDITAAASSSTAFAAGKSPAR